MTEEFSVKVEGLEKIQRMLNSADAKASLIVGLEFGMKQLRQEMRYPPTSEANYPQTTATPGSRGGATTTRWYQRGFGTKYMRKDGSIGGRRTSEPLKDKWGQKLFRGSHIKGVVFNKAAYSPYTHGNRQPAFHGRRGWKKIAVEGKKLAPKITKLIIAAYKRTLKRGKA